MTKEYIIENFTVNVSVGECISRLRDEKRFVEFCKQCPNYGNSWGCLSSDFDIGESLRQHEYVHLMATKITPVEKNIPMDRTQELIKPERLRIERESLEMEHRYGGRASTHVEKYLYCSGSGCARKCNHPCLHPGKVRLSFEVFGFDTTRTLSELFGTKLLWGRGGVLPKYLVIASGLFHNSAESIISHIRRNQDSGNP